MSAAPCNAGLRDASSGVGRITFLANNLRTAGKVEVVIFGGADHILQFPPAPLTLSVITCLFLFHGVLDDNWAILLLFLVDLPRNAGLVPTFSVRFPYEK